MKSKVIGYVGIDSGAFVLGDLGIESWGLNDGPFNEMKHVKADATVAQGFVIPTVCGDGIYALIGHFEDEVMVAVTIELEQ